jgi:hypothetical protein
MTFERIDYFTVENDKPSDKPFKSRLQYYLEDGKPHRYLEIDTDGNLLVEYIWQYDENGMHTGAVYTEDGEEDFAVERVSFSKDKLIKTTEWLDSASNPYYKMVEDLNQWEKPDRAAFIGDQLHGYDSTYFNDKGDEIRIFFTNTKGKVFNDRYFNYLSYNGNNHWTSRHKITQDTIRELHQRMIYYDNSYLTEENKFMEGILSMPHKSENSMSLTSNGNIAFFTRGKDWQKQLAYISQKVNGVFEQPLCLNFLDTIYNGAISPSGNKIIYTTRNANDENLHIVLKNNDANWSSPQNITEKTGIKGGYFNWYDESTIYFYTPENEGDLVVGTYDNGLKIDKKLDQFNTKKGCEFSPFMDKDMQFFIFTRYLEGNKSQQGFFISYNSGTKENPNWSVAKKINALPYGWGAFVSKHKKYLYWTDGDDLKCSAIVDLKLEI